MYEWREESAVQGGWRNAMGQFVNHVTLKGAGSVTHLISWVIYIYGGDSVLSGYYCYCAGAATLCEQAQKGPEAPLYRTRSILQALTDCCLLSIKTRVYRLVQVFVDCA